MKLNIKVHEGLEEDNIDLEVDIPDKYFEPLKRASNIVISVKDVVRELRWFGKKDEDGSS